MKIHILIKKKFIAILMSYYRFEKYKKNFIKHKNIYLIKKIQQMHI